MKQDFIIVSEEHRRRAIEAIEAIPLLPAHKVTIREHKKDRSAAQNALMWSWYTIIGNSLGEPKEEVHERYKERFLCHIYERDNPDYAEMMQSLRNIWRQGLKTESVGLCRKIVALTSTTTATVAQMAELLACIEHDAASLNIRLPHPDDQYYEAMGIKKTVDSR